jgi:hypothetical protein
MRAEFFTMMFERISTPSAAVLLTSGFDSLDGSFVVK